MSRKPRNPDKNRKAIQLLSQGHTALSAAKGSGLCRQTVAKLRDRHRELIESNHARLIEAGLNRATNRMLSEIETAEKLQGALTGKEGNPTILEKAGEINEYLKRVDRKEEMLLKSVGIAPSAASSIFVQNIYNDNSQTVLSPMVSQLLNGKIDEMTADIEDAEYEEVHD